MKIADEAQRGKPVSLQRYFDQLLPEDVQDEIEIEGFFGWLDDTVARQDALERRARGETDDDEGD